jgi:PAS domain S-box-containing protein
MPSTSILPLPAFAHPVPDLLAILLREAPAALALLDRDLRCLAATARWAREFRLDPARVVGLGHPEIAPGIPERLREAHRRCLRTEEDWMSEEPVLRPDGGLEWIHHRARPWRTPEGAVGGILLQVERITDRKVAQQAARESEALFRATLETLPMPAGLFRRAGATVAVNRAFREIFGYALEEVPTQAVWRALAYPGASGLREAEATWDNLSRNLRQSDPPETVRTRRTVTARDGSRHRMEVSLLMEGDFVLITYLERPPRRRG